MYKIVLLRHGESVWNKENRFTGWTDVDLSEKGITEAHKAGKVLKEKGFQFDVAFTSVLKRASAVGAGLVLSVSAMHFSSVLEQKLWIGIAAAVTASATAYALAKWRKSARLVIPLTLAAVVLVEVML